MRLRANARIEVALGLWVLVDVLRVFLPSLITIFGRAGDTPPESIGLYALSWFLAVFLAIPLTRLVSARRLAVGAGLVLVLARLALQATGGGHAQLYLASLALLAGLTWLVATVMATRGAAALDGFVIGLVIAASGHAFLDTVDLIWWPVLSWQALLVWPILLAQLGIFSVTLARRASGTESGQEPAAGDAAVAPRVWLTAGPALVLWGMSTGNAAHAQAAGGWPAWTGGVVAALVAVTGLLSLAPAMRPQRWTWHPLVPSLVLLLSTAVFVTARAQVDGVHGVASVWTVVAQVVGQLALAACLGWAATTTGPDRAPRRGLALASGLLVFVALVFAYYAAYDLYLPNWWVPIVAAAIVAALGVIGAVRTVGDAGGDAAHQGRPAFPGSWRRYVVFLAVSALVVTFSPMRVSAPRWRLADGEGLRVAAYNIRMGYGLAGTLTLDQQAATLRRLGPHVIVLSEVDRGWLLNGGHDDLRLIADRLGMRYVWAPAADEVWGDALLTNLPITSTRNHVLTRGGPTGAQALEVGVRWRGRDITVIATHLQPPPGWRDLAQVEHLGRIVRGAGDGGRRPVVVAGDLNIEPGEPAWRALMGAGLTDPLLPVRPFTTVPGTGSVTQIDHVLVTAGFTGRDQVNPDVPYSDHRPIAVTLVPPG